MLVNYQQQDDLTQIKGIGPARQKWFAEALNVYTFADLAQCSVDEIEARLKQSGRIAARSSIERWIAQAQQLSEKAADKKVSAAGEAGTWAPKASFVVEFQERVTNGRKEQRTAVQHIEMDRNSAWPGLETEHLCQWMGERLSDEGAVTERPAVAEPAEDDQVKTIETSAPPESVPQAKPTEIQLIQVQTFQPPAADHPVQGTQMDQPFLGFIAGDQPFALKIDLNLADFTADEAAAQLGTYSAHLYTHNLITDKQAQAPLSLQEASPESASYSNAVAYTETVLPTGRYRLSVLVKQSDPRSASYFELPMIHVI